MSNRVNIERRKIEKIRTGRTWFEVYISDDYNSGSIEFNSLLENDLDLLKECLSVQYLSQYCKEVSSLLDHIDEFERGVYIDDTWYDWEEIKHVFKEVKKEFRPDLL